MSVVKDGVNLRSGPDAKYEILYELPAGYPLKVLEKKNSWFMVSDYQNDRGWIYSSLVSNDRYVIVKASEGNVRSGPGTNYDTIGQVYNDVILKKISSQANWVKVTHPQLPGGSGWVHQSLIWP
ncbi:MAG: SH3 domain-containing protein [Desulfobulbaceae bacterium]|nr:SH3 domain-containing protein [Desulfobulbaceae bacterium]